MPPAPCAAAAIVLAQARFPGLTERVFRTREGTVYQLYQTRYGINIVRAAERLKAALADRGAARILAVAPGVVVAYERNAQLYMDGYFRIHRPSAHLIEQVQAVFHPGVC